MTLEERVARWPERWIRQGIEQSIEQGVEKGIQQGVEKGIEQGVEKGTQQGRRELLRHQAEARFGARTAERLFTSLRQEDDPQRLDAIGVVLMRCSTGDELLRQARQAMSDA